MEKRGINQETLKLVACVSMLLDHIGYVFFPGAGLRLVGRLAFPIYCFLLVEGAYHTRHPGKYGLRLLTGAVLSEIPFDLLFFGELTFAYQNVMWTLLIGFWMIRVMERLDGLWRYLIPVPACFLAEVLCTDYGGMGVALIALFYWSRGMEGERIVQLIGMALLFSGSFVVGRVPLGLFALFSLVFIGCYDGRKASRSKALQWAFYLFYPAHMLALFFLRGVL